MGALRNPLPDTPPLRRKPVASVKNYTYDREKMRRSAGFFQVSDTVMADLPRLSRGESFTFLVLAILRYAGFESGATKQSNRAPDAFTEPIADEFWANYTNRDIRELQRNYDYGTRAKVIERVKVGASHSKLRLRLENWGELPDYKIWLAANIHEAGESDDEPAQEDPAANDATEVQLLKAPAPVRPGKACRPMKIDTGVKSLSLDWSGVPKLPIGLMYLPQIKGGDLVVHLSLDQAVAKKVVGEDKANEKRRGCRTFTNPSPKVRHSQKGTEGEYNHPKAATLCEIFNPLLLKSRSPLLQSNEKALQAACEAFDGLEQNDLLEFLGKGRAKRELSSPKVVALIIQDAKRDKDARGKLTGNSAEIDRLCKVLGLLPVSRRMTASLEDYIAVCKRTVGDPDCSKELQDAARVLGRMLVG